MDGLLAFDNGSLAIAADGTLILSIDPEEYGHKCCVVAIVIWNSNSAKDDNFKVLLNGTEIGTIDNSTNTCTGRIFATDAGLTAATLSLDSNCTSPCGAGANFEPTLLLDEALLIAGENTLRIESTLNANNGNFGDVRVVRLLHAEKYAIDKSYFSGFYNFVNGVGNGQDYTFTYP